MNKELQENLRMVAVYMGATFRSPKDNHYPYYRFEDPIGETYAFKVGELKYHTSLDWQIPVWAKLQEERIDGFSFHMAKQLYHNSIDNNKPEDGFEIICQIIEQINKQP